jgi:hypothetical protein
MFADLNPINVGGYRSEGAANFGWSFHLEIVHILMGRATWKIDHDDGFVF